MSLLTTKTGNYSGKEISWIQRERRTHPSDTSSSPSSSRRLLVDYNHNRDHDQTSRSHRSSSHDQHHHHHRNTRSRFVVSSLHPVRLGRSPDNVNSKTEVMEDLSQKSFTMFNRKLRSKDVFQLAAFSRLVILGLQLLAVELIPGHENDGFKFHHDQEGRKILDEIVHFFLKGLTSWDGQYFLHIINHGYTEENTMAFFPLFPLTVSTLSQIVHLITFPVLTFSGLSILVGVLLNFCLFVKCAQVIHRLVPHFDDGMENLAGLAVLIFCFNPASIFFSAVYSEALFAYLTFGMLLALYERKNAKAFVCAALSAICRSNGVLNFGFYFAFALRDALMRFEKNRDVIRCAIGLIGQAGLCFIGLIPFLGYQVFCYQRFCDVEYVYPAKIPEFCAGSNPQLPYQYIQSHNWDVGFLRYFEVKQLPNFFLAAPVLYMLASHSFPRCAKYIPKILKEWNFSSIPNLAIVLHGAFLTIFCLTCMHVQVSTRLIFSSCPYLIIFIAKSVRKEIYGFRTGKLHVLPQSLFVYGWCVLYVVIGSLAFSTGYPWT